MRHTSLLLVVLTIGAGLAETPTYLQLHRFKKTQGYDPASGVVRDSKGNLYGTTSQGGTPAQPGAAADGVVYKLDTKGRYKVLYTFSDGADGGQPFAGLVLDRRSNLYGTTPFGGSSGKGVIFKLDPAGHEKVLYNFNGVSDGGSPSSRLVRDSKGNLYGIAAINAFPNTGLIYKLDSTGQFSVLYTFPSSDAAETCPSLIRDDSGNFYGACGSSGSTGGVIYKLDADGQRTNLYTFGSNSGDGTYPESLIRDNAGNLYGTTAFGAANGSGNLFKIDPDGNETILYNFDGLTGYGATPQLAVDDAGSVYGTTTTTIYKVDPSGKLTVLYGLDVYGGHYGAGGSGVIRDPHGNLYGTIGTEFGGALFELKQ